MIKILSFLWERVRRRGTTSLFKYFKGSSGQLGLGHFDHHVSKPSIVPFFEGMKILQVSAGEEHSMVEMIGLFLFFSFFPKRCLLWMVFCMLLDRILKDNLG